MADGIKFPSITAEQQIQENMYSKVGRIQILQTDESPLTVSKRKGSILLSLLPCHSWPAWTLSDLTELQVSFHTFFSCLHTSSVFLICWNKYISNVIKQAVTLWGCECVWGWFTVYCHELSAMLFLLLALQESHPSATFMTVNESPVQTRVQLLQ